MGGIFLRRSHPQFFVAYQGALVAAVGTGLASVLADPHGVSAPILEAFYDLMGIHAWGWLYLATGAVLAIGLWTPRAARLGLAVLLGLLLARMGLQLQQLAIMWRDG